MCEGDLEWVGHLWLHSPFARALWELAFSCLGIFWVSHNSISDQLLAWKGHLSWKPKNKKALALPHVIFWSIWRERNRRVFERVEFSLEQLTGNVTNTLFLG